MKVVLDTNILLDVLLNRAPFVATSESVIIRCEELGLFALTYSVRRNDVRSGFHFFIENKYGFSILCKSSLYFLT
jgi:hypothetical protein